MVKCPVCGKEMHIRIGRSMYNNVTFWCKCGEIIDL